jgi:hypothetical protein
MMVLRTILTWASFFFLAVLLLDMTSPVSSDA